MKFALLIIILCVLALGCATNETQRPMAGNQPLADTLAAIFTDLKEAALDRQSERFLSLLDKPQENRLRRIADRLGFASLHTYLGHQFASWPDPDTLAVSDLIRYRNFARVAWFGRAASSSSSREKLRWTFVLFRHTPDGWRLSAVSKLEKDRYGQYGTELTYLETELPSTLRFPRLF